MTRIEAGTVLDGAIAYPPASARGAPVEGIELGSAVRMPVVPNLFHFARLTELMLDHFGDDWLTTGTIDVRYVIPLHVSDSLQPHARVTRVERQDDGVMAQMDIWCTNQRGEELARGTASCLLHRPADR